MLDSGEVERAAVRDLRQAPARLARERAEGPERVDVADQVEDRGEVARRRVVDARDERRVRGGRAERTGLARDLERGDERADAGRLEAAQLLGLRDDGPLRADDAALEQRVRLSPRHLDEVLERRRARPQVLPGEFRLAERRPDGRQRAVERRGGGGDRRARVAELRVVVPFAGVDVDVTLHPKTSDFARDF